VQSAGLLDFKQFICILLAIKYDLGKIEMFCFKPIKPEIHDFSAAKNFRLTEL
jgi:hypothetical protein